MWRCMDHVRGIKMEGRRMTQAKHVVSIRETHTHAHTRPPCSINTLLLPCAALKGPVSGLHVYCKQRQHTVNLFKKQEDKYLHIYPPMGPFAPSVEPAVHVKAWLCVKWLNVHVPELVSSGQTLTDIYKALPPPSVSR